MAEIIPVMGDELLTPPLPPLPTTPMTPTTLAQGSPTKAPSLSFPFVFLPPFVKQHVPKLASAVRAASGRKEAYGDLSNGWSPSALPHQVTDFPGTITPPPSYTEAAQSRVYNETTQLQQEAMIASDAAAATAASLQPATSSSANSTGLKRSSSGIKRKYSRQGLNLLALSAQESASRSTSPSPSGSAPSLSTPFSRQLYIHALTYLLRGLPDSLSSDEITCLRSALPASLDPAYMPSGGPSSRGGGRGGSSASEQSSYFDSSYRGSPANNTSYLHRIISATTLRLFMLISLLIPYIQATLAWLYNFERKHHVSERMFSGTVYTADMLGKRAIALTAAIWGLNEGKVGAVMQDAAFWVIRGVGGGFCQGVGQGMEILAPRQGGDGGGGGYRSADRRR